MRRAFNHTVTGIHNRLTILNQIRLSPGITRKELSEKFGLTKAAITKIISNLLKKGYIYQSKSTTNRNIFHLFVNNKKIFTIGLSCDLNEIQGTIVDFEGTVVEHISKELGEDQCTAQDYLKALTIIYKDLMSIIDKEIEPIAIGLAAMGPLDVLNGKIFLHSNNPSWSQTNFVDELSKLCKLPVYLEKNFTAAAFHEIWTGTALKYKSVMYLFLGHGVGGSFIFDNKIYRGSLQNAGEIGHHIVVPNGLQCICGRKGCLEQYLSFDRIQKNMSVNPNYENLVSLFNTRDSFFMDWIKESSHLLLKVISDVSNLLDLDCVMLSGRFPNSVLEYFASYLTTHVSDLSMKGKINKIDFKVVQQRYQPSLGAALIPMCELLNSGVMSNNTEKYAEILEGVILND